MKIVALLISLLLTSSCSAVVPGNEAYSAVQAKRVPDHSFHGTIYDIPTFARRSAEISPATDEVLTRAARVLVRYGGNIDIIGQADNCDSEQENKALSLLRARNVRDRLVSLGVPAKQILSTSGIGSAGRPGRNSVPTCNGSGYDIVELRLQLVQPWTTN